MPDSTILEVYKNTVSVLKSGGIENCEFEAVQLMRTFGLYKEWLISEPDHWVSEWMACEIPKRAKRRLSGEPLQYIMGEWDFYGRTFKLTDNVFIPRQDTETLVEVAIEFLKHRPYNKTRTVDLCAGTGCIGITLAKTASSDVTCVELSYPPFICLQYNANWHITQVNTVLGDALDENLLSPYFDLVVCNPPYLSEEDMQNLQDEVTFEPKRALYGGEDGLDFYRGLIPIYAKKLAPDGMMAFEIGKGQEKDVCGLFRKYGLDPKMQKDANGIIRVVYGGFKENDPPG